MIERRNILISALTGTALASVSTLASAKKSACTDNQKVVIRCYSASKSEWATTLISFCVC